MQTEAINGPWPFGYFVSANLIDNQYEHLWSLNEYQYGGQRIGLTIILNLLFNKVHHVPMEITN